MSKAEHNIVPYNKVDLSRVSFTELEDNDRIPSQKIAYVRYNDPKYGENQFDIQTPEILLDNYGIPDADGPYYQTTKQRAFFKVPLDVNPNVTTETEVEREKRSAKLQTFKKMLQDFDTWMTDKDNQAKIFGSAKNAKKYSYQPFVRQPRVVQDSDSESDDEEAKETVARPDYTKAKIPLDYNTEKVIVDVFQKNQKGTEAYETDGSHTDVEVTTLDDLKQHVRYMRKGRYVFHVSKLWASKQPASGQSLRMYGLTLKLRRVEVQPRSRSEVTETVKNENPFIESDDEDDVDQRTVKHFVEAEADGDESEEEESEEESEEEESEEEQVVQAKPKGRKRASKKSGKNI